MNGSAAATRHLPDHLIAYQTESKSGTSASSKMNETKRSMRVTESMG